MFWQPPLISPVFSDSLRYAHRALTGALRALKAGDAEKATALLQERLNQVRSRRRRALRSGGGDDSSSSDSDDDGGAEPEPEPEAGGLPPGVPAELSQVEWEALAEGSLSAACAPTPLPPASPLAAPRLLNFKAQLDATAT